jgi:hypothetical protein
MLTVDLWKSFPSRTKRILTILAFFLISILITIAGTFAPLSHGEANEINQELEKTRQNISVQLIFGNNFMICLIMFVPAVGPIFGGFALYNTGVAIAAESIVGGFPPLLAFISLFIFPFTWLEFLSYSTALAESFWLIGRIFNRKVKRELTNLCVLISICAVMLFLGAIIETALIMYFGG